MLLGCHILTPTKGTVLEKYVERGEFVSVGKPLFKIADTESMHLRAYVTSAQLQHIKIGQQVKVFADYGDGQRGGSMQALSVGYPLALSLHPRLSSLTMSVPTWCMPSRWLSKMMDS